MTLWATAAPYQGDKTAPAFYGNMDVSRALNYWRTVMSERNRNGPNTNASAVCPIHNVACSTAHCKRKCRCHECVEYDRTVTAPRNRWHKWKRKGGNASYEEYTEAYNKTHCDCCGASFEDRAKHVDHCHETGKLRGTLCHNCNVADGLLGGIEGVNKLREYLNG